jgi:nickel transport protein
MFTLLLPIFLCAFLANPCMAHDFWVEKVGGTLKVIYGHGIQRLPYDPATIKEVQAFDAKGKEVGIIIEKKKESATLVPKGPVSMVTMTVDDGFWVKTIMGLKKGTRREVRRAIESYQAMDYSKAILSWGEGAGNPLGLKLEIIPLANPFEMKAGHLIPSSSIRQNLLQRQPRRRGLPGLIRTLICSRSNF